MPPGTTLLQYVDDLLITAESEQDCKKATHKVLTFLASHGHKVSLAKLQYCQQEVAYLGHLLSQGGRRLSPERVKLVQNISQPKTKRDVRAFLGMVYCRQWIPNYSLLAKPLSSLILKDVQDPVPWDTEHQKSFAALKTALCNAPALGTPDYTKRFALFVHEVDGCALSVLTQKNGEKNRPCAYFSLTLDPVARGLPNCLRNIAAAAAALKQADSIILGHEVTVYVPHSVDILLNKTKTQHLTNARLTHYELTLMASNVTLKRCNIINPATLMPLPSDQDEVQHDCVIVTETETKGRVDLVDVAMLNVDGTLFVDGSCLKRPDGTTSAAYAVTTTKNIVESCKIQQQSAQAAELIALTRACKLSEGLTVNIYTDSQYAFGVAHNFGRLWAERGYITSSGAKIQHGHLITRLLNAIALPKKLAIVKCSAHRKVTDDVGKGNALADQTARNTALAEHSLTYVVLMTDEEGKEFDPYKEIKEVQSLASEEEKAEWKAKGYVFDSNYGAWVSKENGGRWVLPNSFVLPIVQMTHGAAHVGADGIVNTVSRVWENCNVRKTAVQYCKNCIVCVQHNVGKGITVPAGHFRVPEYPFECLQMDYIQMPPSNGKNYVLVIICSFSNWVEAFPLKDNTALSTAKVLLKEYFPRYSLPRSLWSDTGVHFVNEVMDLVCKGLGIHQKFHSIYHAKAAGLVERCNETLKNKIAKICASSNLSWVDALPLALFSMRTVVTAKNRLSPFEVVMGRPPNMYGVTSPSKIHELTHSALLEYCKELTNSLSTIHQQVRDTWSPPLDGQTHIKPGDWVLTKNFIRKNSLQPRWKGPVQVLLATQTAVRCEGHRNWIHLSHVKRAPPFWSDKCAQGDGSGPSGGELVPQITGAPPGPRYNLRPRKLKD